MHHSKATNNTIINMNNIHLRQLIIAALALVMVACGNYVDRRIDSLERLVADVERDGANYTGQNWHQAQERYEDIMEDLGERSANLTDEQMKEIGRLSARYHKVFLANASALAADYLNATSQIMSGYMEEMTDEDWAEFSQQTGQTFQDSLEKYNKIFDEMFDD